MKNHKNILGKVPGGLVLGVAAGHGRATLALLQNLMGFKQVTASGFTTLALNWRPRC